MLRGEAGGDELLAGGVALDVAGDDRIQNLVGREGVLILLIRAKLS